MSSFLANPYPVPSGRLSRAALTSLSLGAFVAIFLIAFKPFGTANAELPNLELFLAGYGVIAAVVSFIPVLILRFFFPALLSEDRWNIGNQLLFLTAIVSLGITASYFYLLTVGGYFSWTNYFYFFRNGLLVASFPIVVLTLLDYIRKLRHYENGAERINNNRSNVAESAQTKAATFDLTDSQGRVVTSLTAAELWCLHSDSNYVEVWRMNEAQETYERVLIRNTITALHQQLPESGNFLLCHRSWVVNIDLIEHVSGNAQGYRLHRANAPTVAVSRGRSKAIISAIEC